MQDLLTVVIPNYNNSKYLSQCVKSVMNQTYHPLEVIVVDDCSTDNSKKILDGLCAEYPNLRVVYQSKNCGVSTARNVGIECASGEYITTLDSDDYYINDCKLENEMRLAASKKCLAYSKIVRVDEQGERGKLQFLKDDQYLQGDIRVQTMLCKNMNTIPRDYVVPKSLYSTVGGYNQEMKIYEDLDILLRLLSKVEARCTFEEGTAYRQVKGGLSSKPQLYKMRVRWKLCWRYRTMVPSKEHIRAVFGLLWLRAEQEAKILVKRLISYEKNI